MGWGTPIAIRAGNRDEIIVSSMRKVYAYDSDSGAVLWTAGGSLYEVNPTPVVGHGLVFASSGRAGPALAIRPGGSGDVTTGAVLWQGRLGEAVREGFSASPVPASPALVDRTRYVRTHGHLIAIE